jgi:two-component system sensor histidine kinase FlrB
MNLLATPETIQKNQPLELEDAFHAFNQISQHLTDSYQQLEQQVVVLSKELSVVNSQKIQYLSDKEKLATQLEGLIEAIPGAVVVLNEEQEIIKANACARTWLCADMVGQRWSLIRATYLIGNDLFDEQFTLDSGQVVALSTTKLTGASGDVVLLSDITQQQELHQQLEHKRKLAEMGEFSASLAHQIRTPLSSALLYASQLNSDALTTQEQQKFSAKLLERLRLLNSQVTDMLNYSHSGQFLKSAVVLPAFIQRLDDLYQGKAVDFSYQQTSLTGDVEIYISKNALIGAISNLLDNGLDAVGLDARVLCKFELGGARELKISIEDKGVGLTMEQKQRVFEPFYTNKSNGTGLGLAVVNEVVNAHNGEVRCISEIGVGTTMELVLPVVMSSPVENLNRSL